MKKFLFIFGILVLILAIFNPSEEAHKKAVKLKLQKSMQKSITEQDNKVVKLAGTLGMALGNMVAGEVVENMVTRKNYFLFSLTNVVWQGEDQTIGWGVLGNVYVSDKIDEELEKFKKELKN